MIAFEVKLNGERVCIGGAEDLSVLTAHVTAAGQLGDKSVSSRPNETTDLFYSVGGLAVRPDPHQDVQLRWKSHGLAKVGDVIEVTILDTDHVDPPKVESPRDLTKQDNSESRE